MDISTLHPTPISENLKKEIIKAFKLHCSKVNYEKNGRNIEHILQSKFPNDYIKAGKILTDSIENKRITTTYLDRSVGTPIDFKTDTVAYADNNEYIQKIKDVDKGLYNLIYNGLNNGAFFRNACTRRSFNYWQPLSNAGIPAVPRADKLHETTFLIHDILHNLIPDLQLSNNDDLNKAVYIVHRVIGEGLCLILADMYFPEALSTVVDYDYDAKNIYQAFKHIKHRDLYTNLKANSIYAVTGVKEGFGTTHEDIEKYLEWFRPVYISDLRWTLQNVENISESFSTYSKWLNEFKPFIDSNCYEIVTTERIISELNITDNDSVLLMTEKIFDFIFKKYINPNLNEIKTLTLEERRTKAQNIFYAFQGRLYYDLKLTDTHAFNSFYEELKCGNFEMTDANYSLVVSKLYDLELISEDDYRIFREVYPHFNSFFISYDADKVSEDTLEAYSNKLFSKLLCVEK